MHLLLWHSLSRSRSKSCLLKDLIEQLSTDYADVHQPQLSAPTYLTTCGYIHCSLSLTPASWINCWFLQCCHLNFIQKQVQGRSTEQLLQLGFSPQIQEQGREWGVLLCASLKYILKYIYIFCVCVYTHTHTRIEKICRLGDYVWLSRHFVYC